MSDFFGSGTIEKPVPENGGIYTGIVSLSGRWAKLEGVQICTPLDVRVTNSLLTPSKGQQRSKVDSESLVLGLYLS